MEIPLSVFPILISGVLIFGLIITYVIAYFQGHLKTKLPLVSSFAEGYGERQIFNVTMMVTSVLWLQMFIIYFLIIINSAAEQGLLAAIFLHLFNSVRFLISLIAGIAMGLLGIFNFKGEALLHISFTNAFLFFSISSFFLDAIIAVILISSESEPGQFEIGVTVFRFFFTFCCCCASYCFCSLFSFAHRDVDFLNDDELENLFVKESPEGTKFFQVPLSLKAAAVLEYGGVLLFCLNLCCYIWDMGQSSFQINAVSG